MHEGINRQDGRHWCAPERTDGSVSPLPCVCGLVWVLDGTVWSAQAEPGAVDLAPLPDEEIEPAQDRPEVDD